MFTDFQDQLLEYMETQTASGKHLDGIDLLQFGDQSPPSQFHEAITADWDNQIDFKVAQSGVQATTRFAITLYVAVAGDGEETADRRLQDRLMAWDADLGKFKGLLPLLLSIRGITSDTTNLAYSVRVLPNIVRGKASDASLGLFKVGAVILLEVTAHAYPTQFVIT